MSEAVRPKTQYKTTNWAAYKAALKARGALTIRLDRDMQWYAIPSSKRSRQQLFSDAAIQFCLSIKCLFGLALRQSLGLVESVRRMARLDWKVPDFSTISRRQKTLRVRLPYRPASHALEVRAIEVTDKAIGDAPMLHELLSQIPSDDPIASVSGDGAYDTKACHAAMRNKALRAYMRLGRRIWKVWSGYHRRSLVETKMHCLKRLGSG